MAVSARKTFTLNLNTQFHRVYKSGKTYAMPTLVVYARKNGLPRNRVGITVSKKIGKANVRNRAKRRLREVYRTNLSGLNVGYDIILVARSRTPFAKYPRLVQDFLSATREVGVLKDA